MSDAGQRSRGFSSVVTDSTNWQLTFVSLQQKFKLLWALWCNLKKYTYIRSIKYTHHVTMLYRNYSWKMTSEIYDSYIITTYHCETSCSTLGCDGVSGKKRLHLWFGFVLEKAEPKPLPLPMSKAALVSGACHLPTCANCLTNHNRVGQLPNHSRGGALETGSKSERFWQRQKAVQQQWTMWE